MHDNSELVIISNNGYYSLWNKFTPKGGKPSYIYVNFLTKNLEEVKKDFPGLPIQREFKKNSYFFPSIDILRFGKFKGSSISFLVAKSIRNKQLEPNNLSYLYWLTNQSIIDQDLKSYILSFPVFSDYSKAKAKQDEIAIAFYESEKGESGHYHIQDSIVALTDLKIVKKFIVKSPTDSYCLVEFTDQNTRNSYIYLGGSISLENFVIGDIVSLKASIFHEDYKGLKQTRLKKISSIIERN